MPYREISEDHLGRAARENAAVVAYGAWRDRVRSGVILAFCLVGVAVGLVVYVLARDLDVRHPRWKAFYMIAVFLALVPFAMLGRRFAMRVLRRRTPEALGRIAARYQIDPSVLVETARNIDAV